MIEMLKGLLNTLEAIKDTNIRTQRMEEKMATRNDLNNAIGALLASVNSLSTEQAAAFQRLLDKINSGSDFQAEVDQIVAINNQVITLISQAQAQV